MKLAAVLLAVSIAVSTNTSIEYDDGSVKLPVLMYHRFLRNPSVHEPYTITPEAFEADLKYLSENGYTAVGTRELLDYAENGVSLPPKPVMLTFDDGHYNNLYYAVPLLEKYGMKAVIFVVGEYSERSDKEDADNPNYSYIRWKHMENLSPAVEIQSHTWGMHKLKNPREGIKRMYGETREAYEEALRKDLSKLNEKIREHTGAAPAAFALPFGAEEPWSRPVLEELGLKICFCSRDGVSELRRGDAECLHGIRRLVRKPGKSAAALLRKYL